MTSLLDYLLALYCAGAIVSALLCGFACWALADSPRAFCEYAVRALIGVAVWPVMWLLVVLRRGGNDEAVQN